VIDLEHARCEFDRLTSKARANFNKLHASEIHQFNERAKFKKKAGVYILLEDGDPVYVGRTRNLQARLQAHVTKSHNSPSFALKRTRKRFGLTATYRKEGSRQSIIDHDEYGAYFREKIEIIRGMTFKFLELDQAPDQYFLEIFASLTLDTGLDGFRTS
jgi:predicted GIY-YIG superfamily endonuclease